MTLTKEERKFAYLIFFRLLLSTTILIVGALILKLHKIQSLAFPFFSLVGLLYVINIPWILLLRKTNISFNIQSYLQFYTDLIIEMALIHYSGGFTSPFIYLPLISIIATVFYFQPKKTVVYSIIAAILYTALSITEFYKLLPEFLSGSIKICIDPINSFYYYTYVKIFTFIFIGYLSSILSTRIKSQNIEIAKLKHLEENILYQIKSGLITIDNNENIIYANKSACDILGYDNEELIGRNWQQIFFGNKYKADFEIIKQAKLLRGVEIEVETKTGLKKIIGFNLSDLKDEEGNIIGKTMVFRDITPIKKMEEKIKLKNKLETIGELAAIMAHELKNPLTSICGAIDVLKESKDITTPKEKELLNVISKESERLSRTLGEFLAFTGDSFVKKEKKEILKIIEEILLLIKNSNDFPKNVIVIQKYNKNDFYFAFMDENKIKQVFFNIILNSLQAMPLGGTLTIEAQPFSKDDANFLKVSIIDTGEGIPDNIKEKIFTPFFTTKDKGIGLGLTVVKKILEKHGWEYKITSEPGQGTNFTIIIPITQ